MGTNWIISVGATTAVQRDTVQKRNVRLKITWVKSQLKESLVIFYFILFSVMLLCYWGLRASSEGISEARSVTTNILCHLVMLWPHPSLGFCPVLFAAHGHLPVSSLNRSLQPLFLQRQVKVWKRWPVLQPGSCRCLHLSKMAVLWDNGVTWSFQHKGLESTFRETRPDAKATEVD